MVRSALREHRRVLIALDAPPYLPAPYLLYSPFLRLSRRDTFLFFLAGSILLYCDYVEISGHFCGAAMPVRLQGVSSSRRAYSD